ncbi:5'-methylthioadenosine/S-adenosylhomocysteine nucleosidase [Phenylobacterium sp. J426]|uniref:5'-methylthioadenosine/S-adenosylhomocysteine nucleosidase n=1 Tax=Phenylobacterium sp. J426 TaxID=2898439 RepID=UPI002150E52F|nr:5'-methylthioadenosine/S-adenosylhomocysteine nucleosidase [Phenylobacterium sp. J426]MCR5874672.1 5'-methylthioadenosine/S-adenosylhomocysteine nucleosidase [Phenylobacterium sp. J426]
MIGILCATPEELAALRAVLDLDVAPETHGQTQVWAGRGLALTRSGLGKVNAASAATLLLDRYAATTLIFSGVAGGLHPELSVGAVLLADRLAVHDYGIVTAGRFTATRPGVIPFGAPEAGLEPVGAEVVETLRRLRDDVAPGLGHPVQLGGITTADYFLNCGRTRDELRGRLGADAIDMESGAVAQVAEAWGAPLYVIRTLSDLAGEESQITFNEMEAMAAKNSAACVKRLLELLA